MNFKNWLYTEGYRTGAKLGLYPDLDDAITQVPPLYASARAADFVTYFNIVYGKKGLKSKNGIVWYDDKGSRIKYHG